MLFWLLRPVAAQDALYKHEKTDWGGSSAYSEICPVFYKDQLVFLVNKNNAGKKSIVRNSSRETGQAVKILNTIRKNDGKFEGKPVDFAPELATASDRNAICFNKQDTRMYIGKSRIENAHKPDQQGYGIFESVFQNNRWSDPVEIEALTDTRSATSNTSHPSLSPDGRRLYFASNRQGGEGGYDIWYSDVQRNGQWGTPVNMGRPVNSPRDEVYPVANPDGRLYFSSNDPARAQGRANKLDIFYTELINNAWAQPVRMNPPFNSEYSDFHLVLSDAAFTSGFFCSDRDIRNSGDIFSFQVNFPDFPDQKPVEEIGLCFLFEESEGIAIDTNLTMWQWEFNDNDKVRALTAVHCFPGVGEYTVKLNIYDKLTKTITGNQTTYSLSIDSIEQPYFGCRDTVHVNELVSFSGASSYTPNLTSRVMYWKFKKTDDVKEKDIDLDAGENVVYRFKSPGKYRILLGIKGTPVNPSYSDRMASYREVVVVR